MVHREASVFGFAGLNVAPSCCESLPFPARLLDHCALPWEAVPASWFPETQVMYLFNRHLIVLLRSVRSWWRCFLPLFQVFVFDVGKETWKSYDWSKITTVAAFGKYDPELMCYAHSRGSRIVLKGWLHCESSGHLCDTWITTWCTKGYNTLTFHIHLYAES